MAEDCRICESPTGRPQHVLVELEHNWVTAPREACLPGYVCLVARTHVTEPFELEDDAAWWSECMTVARGLKSGLSAQKLNYEIHGNTIPHLHLHVFPRFAGDPFEGKPIDGAARLFVRSPEHMERLRTVIQSAVLA